MTPVHAKETKMMYVDHATPGTRVRKDGQIWRVSAKSKPTAGDSGLMIVRKVDGATEQASAAPHCGPDTCDPLSATRCRTPPTESPFTQVAGTTR